MKMIETTTNATAMNVIRERLQLLGIRRITAIQALDLGGNDAQVPNNLSYRGMAVETRSNVFQVRLLVDDAAADRAIVTLRWLASTGGCSLGAIIVSPVEVASESSHVAARAEGPEPAPVSYQA